MPASYVYQDTAVLEKIAPELIQFIALADPIFKYFPIREHKQSKIRWSILDNYRGLMNVRGYDGAPTRVARPGSTVFEEKPGVFGEFGQLDEQELTERADGFPADMTIPMDVSDMIREWQMILTVRQTQRMRQICWTHATAHAITVALPNGGIGYQAGYTGNTLTIATLWSNLTTATPIHDLRQLQFLYGRGTSNNFGAPAEAWMNRKTAGYIMDNRNPADAGGIRAQFGNTVFNNIEDFNKILLAQDCPVIRIYDDSFQIEQLGAAPGFNPGNLYQLYLPDGVVWVVAARPGNELPGEFMWTKHTINGGGTKPYAFVDDYTKSEPHPSVPPKIIIHQGFNGGAVQTRPSQTVTMVVA